MAQKRTKEQNSAGQAVSIAVGTGLLPKPTKLRCYFCGRRADIYHHFKGYAKANRLDVKPFCDSCHIKWHFLERAYVRPR